MRIALLRQRVAGFGGAESTLGYLARGLAAAGHEVVVFGAGIQEAGSNTLGPGIDYVPVPVWGGKTGRLLSYALNSRRLVKQARCQVIFSLERTLGAQVYRAGDGCHREWLERRSPFLSPAGRLSQQLSPFHRVMLALEKRLFTDQALRRIIANSRQVHREIIHHYQVDPGRMRIVYNGLDHSRYQPLAESSRAALRAGMGVPPGARIVLFVGSGFARKGLAFLLEAFATVNNDRNVLWVVGKGATAPYLRLASRLGLDARIKFWGPHAEVAPFYQAATVLALPTIYDPCSNVVLEALGCGAPVVTTAANGASEFLTPGLNGEILPQPDDVTGLSEALAAYLERDRDPQVRQSAQEAVAHLSWDRAISRTLAVLEEAAAETGNGALPGVVEGRKSWPRACDRRNQPYA